MAQGLMATSKVFCGQGPPWRLSFLAKNF